MHRVSLTLLWLVMVAGSAVAHPLPDLRFDRTVHVRLADDAVTVRYTLEINDWTMILDGRTLLTAADTAGVTGSNGYAEKYADKKGPVLADQLRATLDGEPLAFTTVSATAERARDHLQFRFEFHAPWTPTPGDHPFSLTDETFEDRSGAVTLTLDDVGSGLSLEDQVEPDDLRGKSPLDLSPADARRLRLASAVVVVAPPPAGPGPPPEPPPEPIPPAEPAAADKPSVVDDLSLRGVAALFDTGYGMAALLGLALVFGAAHAFTPGHGKTLVAAYLVGERGTVRHALVLGLVTTISHTGSVILVAVAMQAAYGNEQVPARTEAVLRLLGGLLIFAVGAWLFLQRVRGRADHVHLFAGHDHHRGHDRPEEPRPFGWVRVILLGLAGGLIPCWDAVTLLLLAISAGRLGAAIPLLIAFSLGLAAVLVALGIAVVYAHRLGGRRFGESPWFRRLPLVSAVLLVGIGLWFARAGAQTLFAADGM